MTQPEALRLADALDYGVYDAQMARVMDKAAAELRRLHAENTELREENAELRAWFEVESGQLKRAVVAEREACAKVCDEFDSEADPDAGFVLAATIRARGQV